ncbi:MAG: GNAT family N-acetyltransferase [Anaerolineae bacterium]|nr:GNAT family N-acetyltransferase [Anaerolineae bacterium]
MTEIKQLSASDFAALTHLWAAAYPGARVFSEEERERFRARALSLHQEDPTASFYGLFRDGDLQGIMCLYDFRMNFLGTDVPAGGVGQVAVDLLHKKEHVAKELMAYFLRHYRERGAPLTLLYPFRPDFYADMHFGYGTKMSQYRVKPADFPKGPSKAGVRYLGPDDKEAIAGCFDRLAARTHGMCYKTEREMRGLFRNPQNQIVGCEIDGQLRGYLVYTFEQGDTFITNDLHIQEWVYDTPEALSRLVTFLHTQADQVRDVIVDSQDEDFHHLLLDPRNGSGRLIPSVYHESNVQGVGLMIRLVDVARIFELLAGHDFGGQTCTLRLTVDDSFLPENAGSLLLHFERGHVQHLDGGAHDVEVTLDVGRLSALLAGTVGFRSLYDYGLARISDTTYVEPVSRIFAVARQPVCMTHF